ncbi:putative lipid-binding transport protein (Tim44 family) [Ereboglobus sp. PH5-10]|nr:putative lipid-binding transport protein (Tim44 family) [Ereboglobus sp. PH5-10]
MTSSYPYYYGSYGYAYPGVSVNYTTYADSDAPGYALGGALAGGILGGIIGNNSGRHGNTWAGAAIGSTIGLLAGSAADNAAVRQQRAERQAAQIEADNMRYLQRQPAVQQPSTPAPQQPRRQIAPASTPMSQANALFGR